MSYGLQNLSLKRLQYDRANLQRALEAIVKGMSVYRAARQYNVPESTLRDRTRGNVDIEAKISQDIIFAKDEEKK
jgi:tryptophan 2,3-dioxygenase